jgi:hypothetical protein
MTDTRDGILKIGHFAFFLKMTGKEKSKPSSATRGGGGGTGLARNHCNCRMIECLVTRAGNIVSFSSQSVAPENASHHAAVYAARRNGMNSFAMEPRARSDSNSNPYNVSRVHNPRPISPVH